MSSTIWNGDSRSVSIDTGKKLSVVAVSGTYTVLTTAGIGAGTALATNATGGTYGPYAGPITVLLTSSALSEVDYDVAVTPVIVSDTVITASIDPLTGAVTGLVGPDGAVNRLTQPSVKYKFFIPGQQFIGSGTSAKDKSTNTADAAFMASLTEANAWANPGYFTTGAGVNLGLAIPFSKVQFDLASQSIIFSVRVKKVATAGSEAFIGCGDASSVQGFYLSMRALSGGVSKVRPILNTSGGVVSGLADSAATFGEATATDHVLTLAIDAVTKSVFLYCDGALSNTYPSAYTGGTTLSVPFGFGFNTGTSGVTTVAGQFSGAHMLVMTGGLPLNMGLIAQRLSAAPQLPITDADMVF